MDADCTSYTEENNAGELHCMHLPWCSQEFTEFAHKLDLATIDCLRKEKGSRYVQRTKLLELHQLPPINTSEDLPFPIGLPRNCYNLVFLQIKSRVAQGVLHTHTKPL